MPGPKERSNFDPRQCRASQNAARRLRDRLCHPTIRINQVESLPRLAKSRRMRARKNSRGHFEKLLSASFPIPGRKGGENERIVAHVERPLGDSNPCYRRERAVTPRNARGKGLQVTLVAPPQPPTVDSRPLPRPGVFACPDRSAPARRRDRRGAGHRCRPARPPWASARSGRSASAGSPPASALMLSSLSASSSSATLRR